MNHFIDILVELCTTKNGTVKNIYYEGTKDIYISAKFDLTLIEEIFENYQKK